MHSLLEIVEKPAPFTYFKLPSPSDMPFLRKAEKGYIRWNTTRNINPYIKLEDSSGLDAFYLGSGKTAIEVALAISEFGKKTIQGIRALHPYNPNYVNRLLKVACDELYDPKLIEEMNTYLMMNIAIHRRILSSSRDKEGERFRNKVADLVKNEQILYLGDSSVTKHKIPIPTQVQPASAIAVTPALFQDDEQREAYDFMCQLGKFGYPLVQLLIQKKHAFMEI